MRWLEKRPRASGWLVQACTGVSIVLGRLLYVVGWWVGEARMEFKRMCRLLFGVGLISCVLVLDAARLHLGLKMGV